MGIIKDLTDITSAQARIDDLTRQIEHHRFRYYILSQPEISDAEFDLLFHELEALEERFPDLKSPSSGALYLDNGTETAKRIRYSYIGYKQNFWKTVTFSKVSVRFSLDNWVLTEDRGWDEKI